jgi:hypothetical protein
LVRRLALHAEKRGGRQEHLSFDTGAGEVLFQQQLTDPLTPERVYDRQWAQTLLNEALKRLEGEYETAGKSAELQKLKPHLTQERGAIPYDDIATALETTPGAARVAVHRLRRRFREVFREVVAETISTREELDSEVRYILEVLSHG